MVAEKIFIVRNDRESVDTSISTLFSLIPIDEDSSMKTSLSLASVRVPYYSFSVLVDRNQSYTNRRYDLNQAILPFA
jgi:hypothetical protein